MSDGVAMIRDIGTVMAGQTGAVFTAQLGGMDMLCAGPGETADAAKSHRHER